MSNWITIVSRFFHTTSCGKTLDVRVMRYSDKKLVGVVKHVDDKRVIHKVSFTLPPSPKQLYDAFMLIDKALFIFDDDKPFNLNT